MDIVTYGSEFDKGSQPINPNRATLYIAGFSDVFAITYKKTGIYFDLSKMDDSHKLVVDRINLLGYNFMQ